MNTEKAETVYGDGVLTITFPKLEARKAKHLKVTAKKVLGNKAEKKALK